MIIVIVKLVIVFVIGYVLLSLSDWYGDKKRSEKEEKMGAKRS